MENAIIKLSEIECISDELNKYLRKNSPDNAAMAFADLGRFLCNNFQKFRKEEKKEIFTAIEE